MHTTETRIVRTCVGMERERDTFMYVRLYMISGPN